MASKLTIDIGTPSSLADGIAGLLDEKKGKDVVRIDLGGKTGIADYFVIASVSSTTAVKALSDYVEEELELRGVTLRHRDAHPKWIALDYGSVIVHVFMHEERDFYNLERLWSDGENVKRYTE